MINYLILGTLPLKIQWTTVAMNCVSIFIETQFITTKYNILHFGIYWLCKPNLYGN
jgi:hypothetical protein